MAELTPDFSSMILMPDMEMLTQILCLCLPWDRAATAIPWCKTDNTHRCVFLLFVSKRHTTCDLKLISVKFVHTVALCSEDMSTANILFALLLWEAAVDLNQPLLSLQRKVPNKP